MGENILDALKVQIQRNKELLTEYKAIGPPGAFGAVMIQADITEGEKAVTDMDTVGMIRAFEKLRDNN